MSPSSDISELSSVIGELRNFAQQQSLTNTHMLEELKKISERMSSFGEVGATFVEYRKTLHERFGKIHDQMNQIDERCDKIEEKVEKLDDTVSEWRGQLKTIGFAAWGVGTILSAAVSTYGGALLKVLASHN